MDLNDLSESQQELLHPLLRLKTDVSLDSLVVLRDVFNDLSEAYNTFANSIKDAEQKLLTCYNIASSGSLTPQACEALLMVRGNTPNVSNVVLSATAEQPGVLSVMQSMLSFLNRVREEAKQLSSNLDESVVDPFSSFSNEYLKTFGKDEKRAFRQDISGFIPKLQEFKKSANYSHSPIKKYVDSVLKAHKELQACMAYETELDQYAGTESKHLDPKIVSKAKSRTIRAKLSLGNQIRNLFAAAPELNEIGNFKSVDVDTISQLSRLSKKQTEPPNRGYGEKENFQFTGNASEYQSKFCSLEMKRLELISNCFQHWMDNHAKYEKGVYSQLELLWSDVTKFYPVNDYQKFESYLTGKTVQVESTHARLWVLPEPGAINDYTKLKLNTFSESSTPMELSEIEGEDMDEYDMYQDKNYEMETLGSHQVATDISNTNESDRCAPVLNTVDNVTIVQMMESPVTASAIDNQSPKASSRRPENAPERVPDPVLSSPKPQTLEGTSKKRVESEGPSTERVGKAVEDQGAKKEHIDESAVRSKRAEEVLKSDEDVKAPSQQLEQKGEPKRIYPTPVVASDSQVTSTASRQQPPKETKAVTSGMPESARAKAVLQTRPNEAVQKNVGGKQSSVQDQQGETRGAKLLKQDAYLQLLENSEKLSQSKGEEPRGTQVSSSYERSSFSDVETTKPDEYEREDYDDEDDELHYPDLLNESIISVKQKEDDSSETFYKFLKDQKGLFGSPKDHLYSTRKRLDDHMLNLFNRCKRKNEKSKFDWLTEEIDDIVKIFEDYDIYPFTIEYENLLNFKSPSDINVPMLRYSLFDNHMDEKQWTLFSLEVLVLTHRYISSFVNHPSLAEDRGELRDYLLANLGVLDQALIKFRKTIEAFRSRCAISDFEYSVLEIVLKPRDTFTNSSPSMHLHIMDVRYRILLMIDAFSKGEIAINSEKLFVIPEFYYWMYRQLHVLYVSLLQKLARVINLIPTHSKDLVDKWFKCVKSKTPVEELQHGFKFEGDDKVSKMCNQVLMELLKGLGIVNELKEFAVSKFTKKYYTDPPEKAKGMLLELMRAMVTVEDVDESIVEHFRTGEVMGSASRLASKSGRSGDHRGAARDGSDECEMNLKDEDFIVDLDFYNDDDISVLAELRKRRALCFRQCIPRQYKTKPGKFISRKAARNDLISNAGWNRYFKHRVDPVELSKCWGMEEPVVLTICSSLHKYLSCDNIAYSEYPQYFQAIVYTTSFMQTGILPNFNLLNQKVVGNQNSNYKNQIPIVAHSILAASSYWFSKIVNAEAKVAEEPDHTDHQEQHQDLGGENKDEFYKRLRISLTGIKERLRSMLNNKFRVTENVAKQLYILLQMPGNIHYLPKGLTDLNSYLLFDMYKYKTGGVYTAENLLPDYIYHDKSCIELITLRNLKDMSKAVLTQIQGMHLDKAYNKVQFFLAQLLNQQLPTTFSLESEGKNWNHSLLTPSHKERTVSSILYLRFISATFKNELFKCLCEYSKFIVDEALFYILAIFVMMFRVLYPALSENIPNLSLFESDEENDLYSMVNVFRFVVNKNAIIFTNECIEGAKETNDVSLDEDALFPLVVDDILQMLRHQCTVSSNIWNGFVQYAEFSSLLSNCAILHLKNVYSKIKVDPGVAMVHLRRLMLFQREVDSSYIVRSPVSDPEAQEQRLMNCMFFTYKNSNHKFCGHIEFIKTIKERLMRALEHKFVGITEMVDSSLKHETWQSIGNDILYTSGAVDLITVLKYSIRASFELSPPVEWLILPFTNACESSLRSYFRGISNAYALKLLYNIHFFIVQGEPGMPNAENGDGDGKSNASGLLPGENEALEEESEKKSKRTLWKRLKRTIGGKAPKASTHANLLSNLETYTKYFDNKSVVEDLARISSLVYVSNQIIKIPEDIFGFYYGQLRDRDQEYDYLHKAIGTNMVSDTNKFFFLEPHHLLELPHSKSLSSLILASQRILKRDANQCALDVITIIMWKMVFVDFKRQIFYNLYSPDIMEGHKVENIIEKFPQTVYLFIERLPEEYLQFAYNNFFEAFVKSVFYVIRHMRNKDYKFNKSNLKVLYHDVDSLTRILEKYSQDNLSLLSNLKNYIMKLA